MLRPMTNSPEKRMVAEALKDCRVSYRGGWALLGLTAQQAIILSRCVQILGAVLSVAPVSLVRARCPKSSPRVS